LIQYEKTTFHAKNVQIIAILPTQSASVSNTKTGAASILMALRDKGAFAFADLPL